jgi:hypothetical protein
MHMNMKTRWKASLVVVGALAAGWTLGGCGAAGFGGAMIESYRRNSTRPVEAEYLGLGGKRWAVVVSANRIIQADHPHIVGYITAKVTERLLLQQEQVAATGFVPAENILAFQYDHPRWVAMPRGELARELGVDRVIFVELVEYRLNDPGNQYLWDGVATGTVGVIEEDSPLPDEFVFERSIRVTFPDGTGLGPNDVPRQGVATALASRFVDRASWLFYKHEEPYYPKY